MKNDENNHRPSTPFQSKEDSLLERAEALTDEEELQLPVGTQKILHELRVHQIELEMQNEELRRSHEELDVIKSRYFDLYDLAPVGYCTISEKGLILEANLTLSKMLGVVRGILSGQSFSKYILHEDQDTYYLHKKSLFETGEKQQCKLRIAENNGQVFWANILAVPYILNGEKTCHIVLSDDTQDMKAKEILEESETRFRTFFEADRDAIFVLDMQTGAIIEANDSACRIYGYKHEELLQLKNTDMSAEPEETLNEKNKQEALIPVRYHKKKNGTVFPVEISVSSSTVKSRKVLLVACRDISQRMQTEKGLREAEWKFKALFEKGPIAIAYHSMIYDDTGKPINYYFIDANKAYTELTGVEPVGKTVLEAFPGIENDPFDWIGVFGKVAKTGEQTRFEQYLAFNKNYYDVVGYQYEPDHFVAAFINITVRKELEISLANEKKLLETTFMSVGDGIISTDFDGKIILINKVAEALTGWTQEEAFEKPIEEVFIIFDELTGTRIKTPVKKALYEKKTITFTSQTLLLSKDGQKHPIEDSIAPIMTDDDEIKGAVIVFRDVSALRKKQEEINYLVNCDKLTGLYNRRYFDTALFKFDKERYYPLTLVMTDVNGLKLTNDAFGHNAGDVVLVKVANILKNECRENDIVARIGGDEFVLLLPRTDAMHADAIIARINEAISKVTPTNIALSLSMGYAVKNNVDENINDIFKRAEDEMYRHKLSESTSMRSKTIDLIKSTLFETNNREMLHSNRVSEICVAIATQMNICQDDIDKLRLIGLMHDIGKIGVETSILDSPHKLRSDEWAKVKRHSEIGYRILSSFNEFSEMADCVLEHHERWDGKGYPRGLTGENITLFARIISVADAYDAMTAERTYRSKLSDEEAKAEILKCAGTQFDPEIAKIFVDIVLV